MKANKAPEKLYIDSREHWMKSWTAFTTKAKGNDIEYTRTDAFIEKSCAFLKDRIEHDSIDYPMARMSLIEDYKNYMKGE